MPIFSAITPVSRCYDRAFDEMSTKQKELVALALLSALISVVAWEADYVFATFIFAWLTCGSALLFAALRKFGDDAYER